MPAYIVLEKEKPLDSDETEIVTFYDMSEGLNVKVDKLGNGKYRVSLANDSVDKARSFLQVTDVHGVTSNVVLSNPCSSYF